MNAKFISIVLMLVLCFHRVVAQHQKVSNQDSTYVEQLHEVVISATKTKRQLSSLPLPAVFIGKNEIGLTGSSSLNDILKEQTGIITVPDFGGGEGVQIQGLDSQYTLILIDGLRLIGRQAGTLDLNRISVGNVEQIEIVKGASSSLYGSEALGGVINLITKTPVDGFSGNLYYKLGSFNSHDFTTNAGYKTKEMSVVSFLNMLRSDGYDLTPSDGYNTVDPYAQFTATTKVNYNLSSKTKLQLSGRYYTQNQDNIASEDLRGESKVKEWNGGIHLQHKVNDKWKSMLEFYTTRYLADEFLNNPQGDVYSSSYFNQLFIKPELRLQYTPSTNQGVIVGLGYTHESLDRTYFSSAPSFEAPYIYAQYDGRIHKSLNLIIGIRYDSHNSYESQLSPKLAIRYKISENLAIKTSIGYGYKAPDFRQLYFDFTNSTVGYTVLGYNVAAEQLKKLSNRGDLTSIVVPFNDYELDLKAESSVGYNLGFDINLSSALQLKCNAFHNQIQNLIDTRVIARKKNGQNVFSYYNINTVYTKGIECNGNYTPNNQMIISAGYQLLYAKDQDVKEAFSRGKVFARLTPQSSAVKLPEMAYFGLYNRSRHMANLKLKYHFPYWKADASVRGIYRSKYGLFDSNDNNYLDDYDVFVSPYTLWNISLIKHISNNQIGFGIDNLFDYKDPQYISNLPGRLVYAKLNINL